ncbi:unnamed protein product [Peniophora sp. CBMAI 1063]|nr:unnamed protein product [Peniophora sp. CBMAI 1063]
MARRTRNSQATTASEAVPQDSSSAPAKSTRSKNTTNAVAAAAKSPAVASHKRALSGPNEDVQPAKKKQAPPPEDSDDEDEFVPGPPPIQRPKRITADSTDEEQDEPMPDAKDEEDEEVPVEEDEFDEVPKPGRSKNAAKLQKLLDDALARKVGTSPVLRPGGKEALKRVPPKRVAGPVTKLDAKIALSKQFESSEEDDVDEDEAESVTQAPAPAVQDQSASAALASKGKAREVVQPESSDDDIVQDSEEDEEEDIPPPVKKPKRVLPASWTANANKSSSSSMASSKASTPLKAAAKGTGQQISVKKTPVSAKKAVESKIKTSAIKAPKFKKPVYIEIADSDEVDSTPDGLEAESDDDEPQVLDEEDVAALTSQKQQQYQILCNHEEGYPADRRIVYSPSTLKVDKLSNQTSSVIKDMLSDSSGDALIRSTVLAKDTAFPGHKAGVDTYLEKIAKPAVLYTIKQGGDRMKPAGERFHTDAGFEHGVLNYVGRRRCASRNTCATLARKIVPRRYTFIQQYVLSNDENDKERLRNAILALLKDSAFVYPGELARVAPNNPDDTRMKYTVTAGNERNPYLADIIIEYLAKLCFGRDSSGTELDASDFPDASFILEGDEGEERKEVPRTMAAFAATMASTPPLKDYVLGIEQKVNLKSDTLREIFDVHAASLTETAPDAKNALSLTLQELYDSAEAWRPPTVQKKKVKKNKITNTTTGTTQVVRARRAARAAAKANN